MNETRLTDEARESGRFLRRIIFATTVAIGVYGYISGWPLWFVFLLWLITPAVSVGLYVCTGRLRRYRFLFIIYGITVSIGVFEAWQHQAIPEQVTEALNLPKGPGEPDLFLQYDLPGVLMDLYPDRSEILYIRANQLKLCNDNSKSYYRYHLCLQFEDIDLATIREYFDQALVYNSKTDENLRYDYVEILIRQNAPQAEIDAAAETWRRLFPYSERPDPRERYTRAKPPD